MSQVYLKVRYMKHWHVEMPIGGADSRKNYISAQGYILQHRAIQTRWEYTRLWILIDHMPLL